MIMENKHTKQELERLMSLSLDEKIQLSYARITEWYNAFNGNVYVSFSGGKDSTVLLHLVRQIYPDVKAVFSDTGLEYPEIKAFVKSKDNVEIVRPEKVFTKVITEWGYPLISKNVSNLIYTARRIVDDNTKTEGLKFQRSKLLGTSKIDETKWWELSLLPIPISAKCCSIMKKKPMHLYGKQNGCYPIIGTLTSESKLRTDAWLKNGCNSFDGENPSSTPLSFWTEQDILKYILKYHIEICPLYGEVVFDGEEYSTTELNRTGCVYCLYGMHLERGETRFQKLQKTHPKLYDWCLGGGQWIDNPSYNELAPKYDEDWLNWNPKQILVPSKEGLGYKQLFDMVNQMYGKHFYRYD